MRRVIRCTWLIAAVCVLAAAVVAADDAAQASPEAQPPAEAQTGAAEKTAETPPAEPSADVKAEEAAPEDAEKPKKWISGEFSADADAIWSKHNEEVDLDQTLKLNLEIPGYENFHVRSMFWLREDIDSDSERNNPLRDIDDNEGSDVTGDVVYLHLDIDDVWGDSLLRIGRQRIQEGPSFARIDGLYFKKNMGAWDWYAFGGWQASLYDQSFDDPAVGGGIAWQAGANTRIALDAYYLEEDRIHYEHYYRPRLSDLLYNDYPRGTDNDIADSVVSLTLWQAITQNLRLMARLDLHDGSHSELTLQATGYAPSWLLSYELRYRGLYGDLDDRASSLTSFYRILGPEQSYDDFLLVLHRPLTKKITLSLEGEIREVDNDYPRWGWSYWDQAFEYPDKTNQDFVRYAATLSADDLVWGLDGNIVFEYWDIDEFEDSWNVGGEVSKSWDEFTLTFGVDYRHYETLDTDYNIWPYARNQFRRALASLGGNNSPLNTFYYDSNFTVRLRDVKPVEYSDDIFAVSLEGKWAFAANQSLSLGVTFEDDDTDDSPYWRIRSGYTIRF
ncbi:MAG: hypothetical protein HUU46_14150 [Candidatus Hydrogenedentes bacterium]|nr:hypothetical protein [Candidatus Hydrogenedentota bacterium]